MLTTAGLYATLITIVDRGALRQQYPANGPYGWSPRPWGKGDSAEVGVVARRRLAVRRISALLSQRCGALSTIDPYCLEL